jgi:4'-phosphopantetheinyl transferase EntD
VPGPSVVVRTPLGVVVVVPVVPAVAGVDDLPDAERLLAASWGARRQATWAAGRFALRSALAEAGAAVDDVAQPILRDDRGAPALQASLAARFRVSVTHKDSHAAAVVVARDVVADARIGVDLEADEAQVRPRVDAIARQTLHPEEQLHLPDDDDERRRAVLLRFSAKEALYKAIDPYLRRYVGFLEVGVVVRADGLFFSCPPGSGLVARGLVIDVGDPALIVTLCCASPRAGVADGGG